MICDKLQECINEQLSVILTKKCSNGNKINCIKSSDCRSAVKCEEHGKKYVYKNTKRKQVISYNMDGGIIVEDKKVLSNTNKCDYFFVVNDEDLIGILTELKGVDVSKALEQIKGSLFLYKDVFKNFKRIYGRIIVTSSTPNLKATPAYTNLEKMMRQKYNGNIKICERQLFEKDIDLDKK